MIESTITGWRRKGYHFFWRGTLHRFSYNQRTVGMYYSNEKRERWEHCRGSNHYMRGSRRYKGYHWFSVNGPHLWSDVLGKTTQGGFWRVVKGKLIGSI